MIIVSDSDEESPTNKNSNHQASKEDTEEKELTREDLDLCISPYQRYYHDHGTHHMRNKKVE